MNKLPYLSIPGSIPKILAKIAEVRRPERFTQDYLETILGFRGGNYRAIIPLLKRMEFLNADGSPTALYDQYRNDDTRSQALATGIRRAYSDLFDRNEFAYALPREKLASLIVEMSGLEKESQVGKLMLSTFWFLKETADFQKSAASKEPTVIENNTAKEPPPPPPPPRQESADGVEFRVGYTINLNLPETTNPDVFNAIFKALKEHLLRN
ncbi:DUF5343 domain-containing protein [Bradyrhizobium symbiodeficiens]|uniref:DUF5343 domain-containing protein n=1 Tax=Bradyrhizobium symbiodeficiens TaxID=1404367 RepID=A0A6G8ZZI2_9BRAD|nr:DUF5343 domain-containing protein [Bradyrhizobium symbiodeficiens]QIP05611.1 DUF5343 domain-containing protein [Bradyrhizobium symbiodeficiens]